jgi:hypothetical protein
MVHFSSILVLIHTAIYSGAKAGNMQSPTSNFATQHSFSLAQFSGMRSTFSHYAWTETGP